MSTNKFRDAALAAATNVTSKDVASKAWGLLKSGYCGGAEPTAKGVQDATAEELKGVGIPPAVAKVWAPLFASAPEDDGETGFDVNKRRTYTPASLVRMYVVNSDDAALNREIDHRSENQPWVIQTAGEIHQAQSATFLEILSKGQVPPARAEVDGREIEPVLRGAEKQAKVRTFTEDPSSPSDKLPIDEVSGLTGASFKDVSHEARQVYREALRYELRGVNLMELRRIARALANKNLTGETRKLVLTADYLTVKDLLPDALRAWTNKEPGARAKLVITEAQTPAGFPPAGVDEDSSAGFEGDLAPQAPKQAARFTAPPSGIPKLGNAALDEIHGMAVLGRFDRNALLCGIPVQLTAQFRTANTVADQLSLDLEAMNGLVLADDSVPIHTWLTNALAKSRTAQEKSVFERALAQVMGAAALPAWLGRTPFLWSDPNANAFYQECVTAYSSPPEIEFLVKRLGVPTGSLRMDKAVGPLWVDVIEVVTTRGKLTSLFQFVLADPSKTGCFRRWR